MGRVLFGVPQDGGRAMIALANDTRVRSHNASRLQVIIRSGVMQRIMSSIGARPAEAGGVLLGPKDSREITHFHFDQGAVCSGTTYSPDYQGLGSLMRNEWTPRGLDMKGMIHSHPSSAQRLSQGDLVYIRRLLAANPDMDRFIAPIVLPSRFRLEVFVVLREQVHCPHAARLVISQDQIN